MPGTFLPAGFTRGCLIALSLQMFTISTTIGNLVFNDIIEVTWMSRRERFTRLGDSSGKDRVRYTRISNISVFTYTYLT